MKEEDEEEEAEVVEDEVESIDVEVEDEDEDVGKVIELSNKNIPRDFSSSILLQDNIGCFT